jgi:hypothetical protein
MKNLLLLIICVFCFFNVQSQIVIDNTPPFNSPVSLVDNVLLGGGVVASNHSYQGDSAQIGWFDAINTNLNISEGIVLSTGDVYALDPINGGGFPFIANTVTDPDLLAVANSVPGMIGQTFTVSSINDVAILEFDFVASSNLLEFKYAFGSQEYFGFENTQYNDVFGFFLSGPGIVGPWSSPLAFPNGSINLAVVPNTVPPLPITISSVCNNPAAFPPAVMNPQYFVDNQNGLSTIADADGFTTVLTATSTVQCGATYHIKLAIADGSDPGLSSYVWLEAGSFSSPVVSVVDDLGIDSTTMLIECDANIMLTVNAGDSATYEWFDSNSVVFSTDSIVFVGAGTYVVGATIAGCTFYSDSLIVLSSAGDSLPPTLLSCVAESNGSLYFEWEHPFGASLTTKYRLMGSTNLGGPYYLLDNVFFPATSYSLPSSSLSQGTQFYYVTTESECVVTLTSDTLTPIDFTISSTDVNCWDYHDGYIAIDVNSVQLTPYSFYLDGVLNASAYPLDTSFFGLGTGTYDVKVSDNAFCEITIPVTISAPGFPLQALASSEVAVCYGGSSGFVVGSSAGGTPGYIYSWYESGNPVSFSDNDTTIGLIAGSYYLSVEDANGCDTFTSVNIIEPQVALQASAQIFGVPCKGDNTGMLVGDAGGGWGPYAYYWLDSQNDTVQSSSSYIFQRDTLFDLFAGIYVLHIYDVRGCFVDYTFNVPEPSNALSIDSLVLVEGIACYSDSVGKAILYATGGQVNYAYLWDNGETSSIADGLTSGYHSVTLSDDWGCEVVDSIYISENPLIESDLTNIQNVSCYGDADGIATISSVGGFSSVYTYFWSQGQQTVGVNLDIAVGLLQGSYFVTTRDILGCEVVDSIYISEPEPLSMEAFELDQIDCYGANDGLAAATAVGGTLPYVFDWDNGQWVGDTINTLTPGLHIVVVTDAKGCSASDTVFTHEPTELMIEIDDTQTILPYCVGVNTASLSAFAYGGTPGYTYVWDDNLNLPQTTTTASALLADNYNSSDSSYTITVTDTKGCIASASTDTLRVYLESMDASVASLYQYSSGGLDSNEVSCFGYNDGGAQVTASGGHAPYAYQWFGGSSATTATINNLYSGVYSVTIRDTNNCMVNRSIVLSEPSSLTFNISVSTSESCLGACDGTILIDSLSGGVALYTALLTDNQTGFITSHSITANNYISNVCSGDYTVALTDINNCPSSVIAGGVNQQVVDYDTYTVASISILTDTICNASSTGVLTILNPNLNPGYSYSWENINNSGVVIGSGVQVDSLVAGIYVLLANYNNTLGCSVSDTLEVVEYSAITNTVTIEHVDCFGESTGSILASSSGTIPPYSYTWNSGQTSALASNLTVGVDTLTVTDGNSCEREFTYSVTEPEALSVNITESSYVLTSGIPLGGTAPFSYSWREQSNPFVSIGTSVTYIVANYGVYYVVVTDGNGCTVESNIFDNISTGVGQLSSGIALSIYPNPFREETTVDFGKQVKQASIKLVDVFGKLIEEYNVIDTDKHILKRENKASGIYFIEIEVEQKEKVIFKLIIK